MLDRLAEVFINLYALWKTLKEGLHVSLRTALATDRPTPTTYTQWKQTALELGAELDAMNLGTGHNISEKHHLMAIRTTPSTALVRASACKDSRKVASDAAMKAIKYLIAHIRTKRTALVRSLLTSNNRRKKRRQGDPNYPPTKKHDTGTVRVTELAADGEVPTNTEVDNVDANYQNDIVPTCYFCFR